MIDLYTWTTPNGRKVSIGAEAAAAGALAGAGKRPTADLVVPGRKSVWSCPALRSRSRAAVLVMMVGRTA